MPGCIRHTPVEWPSPQVKDMHIKSFMWVTGPKTDVWPVKTVGVLVVVIGATLLIARLKKRYNLEVFVLAVGTAFLGQACFPFVQQQIARSLGSLEI